MTAVLTISGWILYYLGDDTVRQWSSLVHWTLGLAILPLVIAHILLGRGRTSTLRAMAKNRRILATGENPSEKNGKHRIDYSERA